MPAKHLLLELEQLDHQAGQGLVGGGLRLDVLEETRQHIESGKLVSVSEENEWCHNPKSALL